jgi:excisionase family DNA binding protein
MSRKSVLDFSAPVEPASSVKVMTLAEVADFLHVHQSTVHRLLKQHKIPAFRLRSEWRFNRESIERWISEREKVNEKVNQS